MIRTSRINELHKLYRVTLMYSTPIKSASSTKLFCLTFLGILTAKLFFSETFMAYSIYPLGFSGLDVDCSIKVFSWHCVFIKVFECSSVYNGLQALQLCEHTQDPMSWDKR